jgi:hypothetical protein
MALQLLYTLRNALSIRTTLSSPSRDTIQARTNAPNDGAVASQDSPLPRGSSGGRDRPLQHFLSHHTGEEAPLEILPPVSKIKSALAQFANWRYDQVAL